MPAQMPRPSIAARSETHRLTFIIIVVATLAWATAGLWILTAGHAKDFEAYYDAALRLMATGTPYRPETLLHEWVGGTPGLYVYTPVLALLVIPLTSLGVAAATMVWFALRIGLLYLTVALMPVPRWVKIATLLVGMASAPVIQDLRFGNVSLLVAFLSVVAWRWLDRPLGSVAIAASVMVRPWLAVIGIWWLLRRRWRAVAWLAGSALLIVVLTLPLVGLNPWLDWVTLLRNLGDDMSLASNHALGAAVLQLGFPSQVAVLFQVAGYVMAAVAIVASLRRDRQISYAVTLTASLLLSPLMWVHYLTLLIVPAALAGARGRPLALLLPLVGWLPLVVTPFAIAAMMWIPFSLPDRGEDAAL